MVPFEDDQCRRGNCGAADASRRYELLHEKGYSFHVSCRVEAHDDENAASEAGEMTADKATHRQG
jgi:hypothetical protein